MARTGGLAQGKVRRAIGAKQSFADDPTRSGVIPAFIAGTHRAANSDVPKWLSHGSRGPRSSPDGIHTCDSMPATSTTHWVRVSPPLDGEVKRRLGFLAWQQQRPKSRLKCVNAVGSPPGQASPAMTGEGGAHVGMTGGGGVGSAGSTPKARHAGDAAQHRSAFAAGVTRGGVGALQPMAVRPARIPSRNSATACRAAIEPLTVSGRPSIGGARNWITASSSRI